MKSVFWTSLADQWLQLCVSTSGGTVSILRATQHGGDKKCPPSILMEEGHKEGKKGINLRGARTALGALYPLPHLVLQ